MRISQAAIIAKREYVTRIKGKGFWISTLLLPLLMGVWMIVPGLVMSKAKSGQRLAVVDETGEIGPALTEDLQGNPQSELEKMHFDLRLVPLGADPQSLRKKLDKEVLQDKIDAWIWISKQGLDENQIEYHAQSVSNFLTQETLEHSLSRIVRKRRLLDAGYDPKAIEQLNRGVDLSTVRITAKGSRAEGGLGAFALGIGLFVILYMTLIIYGNQVMHGVLEEKSSRIVEVLASTVRPVELLSGKLFGICGVALTQLAIWMATALVLTAPGLVAAVSALPSGMKLPSIPPMVVVHFFAFFLLGFFLFASLYAMLGAAFNSQQEAQQLAGAVVILLVAPWMIFMPVINDPDSTLAVVTSLIPVFTPLIMMLRIAIKMPPAWQIGLAYVLTVGACVFAIWLAARVYRVGILMYGKKPTLKEIWRWVRYA